VDSAGSPSAAAVCAPRPRPSTARPLAISLTVAIEAAMTAGLAGAGAATVVARRMSFVSRAATPSSTYGLPRLTAFSDWQVIP
jgi:hypothetical protein